MSKLSHVQQHQSKLLTFLDSLSMAARSCLFVLSLGRERERESAHRAARILSLSLCRPLTALASHGSLSNKRPPQESGGIDAVTADFQSKLLHLAWHPEDNVIAGAASNSLYMFIGK